MVFQGDPLEIILFPQEGQKLALGSNSVPQLLQNLCLKITSIIIEKLADKKFQNTFTNTTVITIYHVQIQQE